MRRHIFIAFGTYRRRPLLATPERHAARVAFSRRAYLEQNVAVGRYVILPNHIHLVDLGRWMGLPKQALLGFRCFHHRGGWKKSISNGNS